MNTKSRKAVFAKFNLQNIKSVPHTTGHYEFHHNGKFLYVGVAGGEGNIGDLHHRLLFYNEKEYQQDKLLNYLNNHKGEIMFKAVPESIALARQHEHKLKQHTLFNQDNQRNNK